MVYTFLLSSIHSKKTDLCHIVKRLGLGRSKSRRRGGLRKPSLGRIDSCGDKDWEGPKVAD